MEWLKGKKTYILVVLGAITLGVQFLAGDITFIQFVSSDAMVQLVELFGIATLRAGVSKIGK